MRLVHTFAWRCILKKSLVDAPDKRKGESVYFQTVFIPSFCGGLKVQDALKWPEKIRFEDFGFVCAVPRGVLRRTLLL